MADIALSTAVRSNLLSLQSTADLLSSTQFKLATGKKVNSALDNPNSFFTARGLENRAGDLSTLLDDMGQSVQTIKAANEGLEAISDLLDAAKAKANQALQSSDGTERAAFGAEFDDILDQIENIAEDSGYKGKNLLGGTGTAADLTVNFNEDASNSLTITSVDYTDAASASGLNIEDATTTGTGTAATVWELDSDINLSITEVSAALNTVRSQASTFGTNLSIVETRQNFTKNLVNTLEEGAGLLTLADTNEEGANMLALQTRQQLGSVSLSLASQADQAVLRLF